MAYTGPLEKVDDHRWRIPKSYKAGMRTDAIIFASEDMVPSIREDNAPEQAANVATLPGIVGPSLAMPDIHWGYGFPIGGVAAMDAEEGVISPGGIGFDINCLCEGSRISTDLGGWMRIEELEQEFASSIQASGFTLSLTGGTTAVMTLGLGMHSRKPSAFMKKASDKRVLEIITRTGLELRCSEDHPLLTDSGMRSAMFLKAGGRIAVSYFEGVELCASDDRKEIMMARIIGYMLGCGSLGHAYGNRSDMESMRKDLNELGHDSEAVERDEVWHIHARSPEFVEAAERCMSGLGSSSRPVRRAFLAGLFGAALALPSIGYGPAVIVRDGGGTTRTLLVNAMHMLKEFDVSSKVIEMQPFGTACRISAMRLLIGNDEDDLVRLYRKIGFEYSDTKRRMAEITVKYMLLRKENVGLKDDARELPPFERFLDEEMQQLRGGALFDDIIEVREIAYQGQVYDLTVPDTHNFIANGMVVSNCGVRLVRTDLEADDVRPHIKDLINALFKNVPAGVGSKGVIKFSGSGFDDVLRYGAEWAVESGYGWKEDLLATEEGGRMKTADPSKVSDKAKQRGIPQIGSLGSGNHFLEIDFVEKIFDEEAAKAFGLREGQVTVTVHCGSRGAGHQIATDYLQVMERSVRKTGIELPDRQLACAPVHSQEGEDYFKAMSCGANYAWANRQMILHWIRQSFEEQFGADAERLGLRQVYDVAHNIAKVEEHQVDGRRRKVYVHRKGATRAFPKDHPDVPEQYRSVGQPALIPGNMGAGSYVLVGEEKIMRDTFGSTCHGAGRVMSRSQALRSFTVQGIRDDLGSKGIFLKSATKDGILEEAPEAYKSIDQVISVVVGAGLSRRVAKLTPLGVMKG
mgnify:CR=1 FL=1